MATNTHAVQLNGTNQHLQSSNPSGYAGLTDEITNEVYFRYDGSTATSQFMIMGYTTADEIAFGLHITDTSLNCYMYAGAAPNRVFAYNTSLTWTVGQYYHLAFSIKGSTNTAKMYIDGVPISFTYLTTGFIGSQMLIPTRIRIGAHHTSGLYAKGVFDYARIWGSIRSDAQILASYQACLIGNETDLIDVWQLNNDYTTETPTGNTLFAFNSPSFITAIAYTCANAIAKIGQVSWSAISKIGIISKSAIAKKGSTSV
jgi:hypothetical protein